MSGAADRIWRADIPSDCDKTYAEIGRALILFLMNLTPTHENIRRAAWLHDAIAGRTADSWGLFDRDGNILPPRAHKTHAMNPIDRAAYEAAGEVPPPQQHDFQCMFCGVLDDTDAAALPCQYR